MYTSIWILIFSLSLLEICNFKLLKTNKILKIIVLFLILITGIRYFNGVDYGTYKLIFQEIDHLNDYSYLEFLFRLIIFINNKFLNYNYNFIIFSIFNFIFLYFALKKLEYKYLSLFIYINIFWIPYAFNGIRQGIAMNCFLLAILINSNLKFFILTIISTGIHKVSLIIFILSKFLLVIKTKIKYKKIIVLVSSLLFFIFSNKFIEFFSLIIPKLNSYTLRYGTQNFSIKGLIFRSITLFIFFLFEKKINNNFYKKVFNIYIFSFLEYIFFINSYMFGTRINMFFRIIELILFSRIFSTIKNKNKKIVFFLFLSIFWGTVYYKEIHSDSNAPYKINPYFHERVK